MNPTTNNRTLKILTAILVLLLVGLSIYTVKFYSTVQDNELELVREKDMIELELRNILSKYDTQIANSRGLEQELSTAKNRITKLIDSLSTSENTREVLRNYRIEIIKLRDQRDALLKKTDSLAIANQTLESEKVAVIKAFDSSVVERDSLRQQNEALKQELSIKTAFSLDSLTAEGVIVRRSGEYLVNDLAKRIDKIQVCYILNGKSTDTTSFALYTQIIDPLNNIIGERTSFEFDGKSLLYSALENVEGGTGARCLIIDPLSEKFEEGIYRINVFNADELLGSVLLQLN